MRYLLLVSHASMAEGVHEAIEMLMGPRKNVVACGMSAQEGPQAFRADVAARLSDLAPTDEVVVLGDIAGGSPLMSTLTVLDSLGATGRFVAFGGLNLPMAISALMAIEEGLTLDTLCDGVLSDGAEGVRRV